MSGFLLLLLFVFCFFVFFRKVHLYISPEAAGVQRLGFTADKPQSSDSVLGFEALRQQLQTHSSLHCQASGRAAKSLI